MVPFGVVAGVGLVALGVLLFIFRSQFAGAARTWRERSGTGDPGSQTPQLAAVVAIGFIVLGALLVVGLLTGVLH